MQFSLKGWPPLASHFSCILVGVALVNLSMKSVKTISFPNDRIVIPLQEKYLASTLDPKIETGQKVYLAKNISDKKFCVFDSNGALVLQVKPWLVLGFPIKSVDLLPKIFRKEHLQKLTPVLRWEMIPETCSSRNEIVYGYGD